MPFNPYSLHFTDEKPSSERMLAQSHTTRKEELGIKLKEVPLGAVHFSPGLSMPTAASVVSS